MNSVPPPSLVDVPSPVRDSVAVTLPCAVALAAAAYGGVEPWSELALIALVGFLLVPALVIGMRAGMSRRLVWAGFAVVAFAALAVSQAVPLPLGVVEIASPTRADSAAMLLPTAPSSLSLSYYSEATWHSLRHVLVAATVFFAVAVSVRSVDVAKRLLLGLFVVGVAQSVLSLAQQATQAEGIYWGSVSLGGVRSGSFVNHSNFAQFLNLTIGASLSLLLTRMSEDRASGRREEAYARSATKLFRRHGWMLIGIAMQGVAIAASHSRAGIVAMLVSSIAIFALLARRRSFRRSVWALLAIPPVVFGVLVLLGFDSFVGRVDTLGQQASYVDRIELTQATLRVSADHLALGTGLGSHAYVFPAYDTTESVASAEQADNDYAQLAEETGVVGIAILLLFAAVISRCLFVATRRKRYPLGYAAYGIGYGLLAIAIQSATDFGQRVPAVYCVTATLCALAIAVVGINSGKVAATRSRPARNAVGAIAGVSLLGLFLVAFLGATRAYRADRWWSIAYSVEETIRGADRQATEPSDYLDLLAASEQASKLDPNNVEYRFWLNAYRWEALEVASIAVNDVAAEVFQQSAKRILGELEAARRLCPTYGPLSTLEGQVRLRLGDEAGIDLVKQGVKLTPNDPLACLAAGVLSLELKQDVASDAVAFGLLAKAVRLDDRLFAEAAEAVLRLRGDVEEAARFAVEDATLLRLLASRVDGMGLSREASDSLRERADVAQRQRVESGNASANEIADLARRTAAAEDWEAAVPLYRKALAARFNRIEWRLALVDALTRLGRIEEAHHEARICLRVMPNSEAARKRFDSLSDKLPVKSSDLGL